MQDVKFKHCSGKMSENGHASFLESLKGIRCVVLN